MEGTLQEGRAMSEEIKSPVVKWAVGVVGGLLTMVLLSYGVTEFRAERNAETNRAQWKLMATKSMVKSEVERAIYKHRAEHHKGCP